jgi:hypothetical protein
MVDITHDGEQWRRWIFDDPAMTRDVESAAPPMGSEHKTPLLQDEAITTTYQPQRSAVTLVVGPSEDQLGVVLSLPSIEPTYQRISVGEVIPLSDRLSMVVEMFIARPHSESRPQIIPRSQRDPQMGEAMSMVQVVVGSGDTAQRKWLRFHHYPFAQESMVLRRFPWQPIQVTLDDGRVIELLFSRASEPLGTTISLEDFVITPRLGGFTGQTSSVLDWTSRILFAGDSRTVDISVNDPQEHGGFWYFQNQWDPPDSARFEGDVPSSGLNYTVLGVGNRNGVWVQLAGCCLAVLGMMWAFYIKPVIRRRRQRRVIESMQAEVS